MRRSRAFRTLTGTLALTAVLTAAAGCKEMRIRVDDGKGAGHAAPRTAAPAAPAAPASSPPAAKPPEPSTAPKPRPKPVLAPGARGEQVRDLQARLRRLKHFDRNPTGYYGSVTAAAVSAFQRDRGLPRTGTVDGATLSALHARTGRPARSELYPLTTRPVAAPDKRCLRGRVICISKTSDTLAWMVDGRVVSAMDVRFGSQYTPTREGTFAVTFKSRHHVSTIYHTAMPYAMFFSGGQAIHYSADFAARGYSGASHGCVNVRDRKQIATLFAQVRPGTKVVIYK
ncbi:murein L,D-transpeptidase [Streptomyces sp. Ru73]|uniref:L,D-transpeptidase family protein n=1 Tax=Streptomyces sp. Ru73 TaxID=2080748 RepID=UPI000CDDC81F|nr:L,D-transpeptidase family protein [Streptomyces sp. Ru73]POX40849.1 murein L,D-transpeptidase [Streptomyces sp. Ru73]